MGARLNDPDLSSTATKDVAGHLHAGHIGELIRLETVVGDHARVDAVVTGELRQVYHAQGGDETVLSLTCGGESTGSLWEITLSAAAPVEILR